MIKNSTIYISPSILSANFANLGQEIKDIAHAGADYIHIDVMDGNFVPNITIGADVIKSLRSHTDIQFDVHLMINNPENFIEQFAKAGSDIITIHTESTIHLDRVISLIKSYGKKVGISLVPSTHPNILDYIINDIDLILVMSVNPGFGGQKFLNAQFEKIKIIRDKIANINKDIILSVDGGINDQNAKDIIGAGANMLVAGSYIFGDGKEYYASNIENLRNVSR